MELVKLGKKGQVSIPKGVLKKLGLEHAAALLVNVTADGSIILRPADVYPIEIYSEKRLQEFSEADRLTPREAARFTRRRRRK